MEAKTMRVNNQWAKKTLLFLTMAGFLCGGGVLAQSGEKTVQIVIPAPPGGSTDLSSRLIANKLGERLGRSFVVLNRPGASMQIGIQAVLDAPLESNTLLVTPSGPISISPNLSQLRYKPQTDLAPVAMIVRVPSGIAVSSSSPIQSLQQLIQTSKTAPGGLTFSVSSIGTHMHLAGELLRNLGGANLRVVGYKGTAPATVAIATSEVDLGISDLATLLPWTQSGKIRILAVIDSTRASMAPSVLTVSELGVKDYSADAWIGMFAKSGGDREWRERLNNEISQILKMNDIITAMNRMGLDPFIMTTSQMSRFLEDDVAKWGRTIKASNISIQ